MPDWLTYSLEDAQVFSARAYDGLLAGCRVAWWPGGSPGDARAVGVMTLAVLAAALAGFTLWCRPRAGARAMLLIAAAANLALATGWLPGCYAELHWGAGWMAGGHVALGVLLAAAMVVPGAIAGAWSKGTGALVATLWAYAWVVLPWGSGAMEPAAWPSAVPGMRPGPTLVAAFALSLLASRGWRWILLPPVLAGLAVDGVTLASIDRWWAVVGELLPLAAWLGITVRAVWPARR